MARAYEDLQGKEKRYREYRDAWDDDIDDEADDQHEKRLLTEVEQAAAVLVAHRDAVVDAAPKIRAGFDAILDHGLRRAQTLMDAMEQGVRDGMNATIRVEAGEPAAPRAARAGEHPSVPTNAIRRITRP